MKQKVVSGLTLFLAAGAAVAEDAPQDNALSLNDLINVTVTVTSKKAESLSNTPGIVSSISMADMRAFGVRTLKDALAHIPGVVVMSTRVGSTTVMIRGLTEQFNQKVLFLLDGVPYWMSSHGDIPLLGVPVEAIDRVEVIRGPGSVMYGTNASAGVINVVLKKDRNEAFAQITGGSNGLFNPGALWSRKIEDGYYFVSASNQTMSGYTANYEKTVLVGDFAHNTQTNGDAWPTSGSITKKEEYTDLVAGLKKGDWNFLGQYSRQVQNGLGGAAQIFNPNDLTYQGFLAHVDWQKKVDDWNLSAYLDHNVYFLEFKIANFISSASNGVATAATGYQLYQKPWVNNFRNRQGFTATYNFSKDLSLLTGIENEIRKAGEYDKTGADKVKLAQQSPAMKLDEYSVFSQVDWTLGAFRSLAGVRYVNNQFSGSHVSPRASLLYNLSDSSSIKLLYSEGFNSPVISQQKLMIPFVIQGNTKLKAELIRTVDFAYTVADSSQVFVANYYFEKTKNVINRDVTQNPPQYVNADSFSRQGIEVDYQRAFDEFKLLSNLAYNFDGNKVKTGDAGALYVPKFTATLGARYRFMQNQTIGFSERFMTKQSQTLKATAITDLGYNYSYHEFDFGLSVENLFDAKILNPDANNGGEIPSIPGAPGRSFYASVAYKF